MANGTIQNVTADLVRCSLSCGSGSISFDIASEATPYLGQGAHSVEKWASQDFKISTAQLDGAYESVSVPIRLVPDELEVIMNEWENGPVWTYTVSGSGAGLFDKTYNSCLVRVSEMPKITPGYIGPVAVTLEISTLMPAKTGDN